MFILIYLYYIYGQLWVLTGDKVETAVNIGKSCQLLVQGQPIVYIE